MAEISAATEDLCPPTPKAEALLPEVSKGQQAPEKVTAKAAEEGEKPSIAAELDARRIEALAKTAQAKAARAEAEAKRAEAEARKAEAAAREADAKRLTVESHKELIAIRHQNAKELEDLVNARVEREQQSRQELAQERSRADLEMSKRRYRLVQKGISTAGCVLVAGFGIWLIKTGLLTMDLRLFWTGMFVLGVGIWPMTPKHLRGHLAKLMMGGKP